jgi:hypothetical protein
VCTGAGVGAAFSASIIALKSILGFAGPSFFGAVQEVMRPVSAGLLASVSPSSEESSKETVVRCEEPSPKDMLLPRERPGERKGAVIRL